MNLPRMSALILGLSLLLTACPGSSTTPNPKPPPETDSLLVEANAWKGAIPADAKMVSLEDFKKGLASGDNELVSTASLEAQKVAQEKQYQDDKAFLQTLPNKSPYVQKLLEAAASVLNADTDLPAPGQKGVLLLGVAQQLRGAVETYKRSQDPANALEAYTLSYDLLSSDLKIKADSPESLKAKSLEAIKAAATKLNDLLSSVENLDNTRLDTDVSSASFGDSGLLSSQALKVGNGSDNSGPCNPNGLFKTYWFPLKKFISPIKDQAQRGTCWAFAAIGALESRERVQNDTFPNLSEQFLVNKVKQDWDPSDDTEGSWPNQALEAALLKGQILPYETTWTYNPAMSRNSKYDNTCKMSVPDGKGGLVDYTGNCSNTAHESERICTTTFLNLNFCYYEKVTYSGAGVTSSLTNLIWSNNESFDLWRYRNLLAQGLTLLADFPVYKGFDDAGNAKGFAKGVVSNYTTDTFDGKQAGGHAVQLVGFLSNDTLSKRGSASNIGGGGYFILKNSWGCVGDGGYYYVPADYVQKYFGSLRTLSFDGRRSSVWTQEQRLPGGTEAPRVELKNQPAQVDLRVETDLTKFFDISHPTAETLSYTVTSSVDGTLYDGTWYKRFGAINNNEIKKTFTTVGPRTIKIVAKFGLVQSSQSFGLTVVNTPPTLELQTGGTPRQGEEYPITALLQDINEPDLNALCAKTVWTVTAPDTLSSTTGCTVKVKFGAQSKRMVKASTTDREGAIGSSSVTLNVLPPPANPFPKIVSSGVYSREFTKVGTIGSLCLGVVVPSGNTVDLTKMGCRTFIDQPTPPRYFGGVEVENPSSEKLTYDWKLFYRFPSASEDEGSSNLGSSKTSFDLNSPGDGRVNTLDCRVTLKVNAPEASRSKGPFTVWSGKCTALYGNRVN